MIICKIYASLALIGKSIDFTCFILLGTQQTRAALEAQIKSNPLVETIGLGVCGSFFIDYLVLNRTKSSENDLFYVSMFKNRKN